MKLKVNYKLGIGFGILLTAILINSIVTLRILGQTTRLNQRIATIHTPSVSKLKDLDLLVSRAKSLLAVWVSVDTPTEEVEQKMALQHIYNDEYPLLRKEIVSLMKRWEITERKEMDHTVVLLDSFMNFQHEMMTRFREPNDYYRTSSTPDERFRILYQLNDSNGDIYQDIFAIKNRVATIIIAQQSKANIASKEMLHLFNRLKQLILYLGITLLIGGTLVAFFTTRSIVKPVAQLREALVLMGRGVLPKKRLSVSSDEIGEMTTALNNLVDGLERTSTFATEIGKGNFEYNYKPLSNADTLGNSLLLMKKDLQDVSLEDNKRLWVTEGVALFSSVLRQHNDNIDVLSKTIISELVKYLNANQGSIYVLDEDKNIMSLTGCYAWDKIKLIKQNIELGDGLVGQCWQEKDILYMNDVPTDYIKITSGLGKANPTAILIAPLIHNDIVYGVIEIASFYEIEEHQIDFVNRITETIAAMIASVRINDKTKHLLEQTRKVSDEHREKEEMLQTQLEEVYVSQQIKEKRIETYQNTIIRIERFNENLREENQVLQNILLTKVKALDKIEAEKNQ